ncbi:helix-turn-helix domain-containing protein [Novosphingobium sp. FGD1]|uniref:Helix-turn-helix domain-containing protein n=1 Tax=Novosphingobium silvae TaxID=2692619 RepID=A0A7X4GLA3_9SPHN|nr:helix-turn-helix transcriptional regulator [Novosphingobium silvae]MYM00325.1 helix-turn-helix domain-containing protein [Novosphingobium silvae]
MAGGKSKDANNQKIVESLLKELRVNAGLRQIDVASALGIQQSMVSKYEVGERRLDILEIRELCALFGLNLSSFIELLEKRLEGNNEAN